MSTSSIIQKRKHPMPRPAKSLILCVHAHQPVGNFGHVFRDAYEKSYRPFFEVLRKHPSIPVTCHFSGSLIDWLESSEPEFLRRLREMAAAGQLEIMGGAYYEPIYGAIPKRDLSGQIELMRKKLKRLFGIEPEGVWLTERVWDPDLVKPLAGCGAAYTVLDDLHLEMAGVASPVTGYFRVKGGHAALDVFASMQALRYLMPFRKPEEVLYFIRALEACRPRDAIVFADDCEKFGFWPGTFDWVYRKGWLERLFTLLEKEKGIALYTFSQFRRRFKAKGVVRVPHASYREMMEWSGGRFDNFFEKYSESRYMRDRMWDVSGRLAKIFSRNENLNGTAPDLEKAREALYKAQCNCTYWHGVFGGLYLHHLRSAVFENIIRADTLIQRHGRLSSRPAPVIQKERWGSGDRWRIRQKDLTVFFNPQNGGALEELDYLPTPVNLMCNLKRYPEAYHRTLLKKSSRGDSSLPVSIHEILGKKEAGLEKHLHYDRAGRLSFMDHFFESPVSPKDFKRSAYEEAGDFAGAPYRSSIKREGARALSLQFKRTGTVRVGGRAGSLTLTKQVFPRGDSSIEVSYCLRNEGVGARHAAPLRFIFGVEFNFSIGDDKAAKGLSEKEVSGWTFEDSWRGLGIRLGLSTPMSLLTAAVETVSGSESGLERTYQGLGALFQCPLDLAPSEESRFRLTLEVVGNASLANVYQETHQN